MTTYAGLYGPEALIDSSGHAITSAVIDVFTHGTTTHVSLYQDNARGTPLSNPVPNGVDGSTAGRGLDTFGNLSFYVDPGRYDLRIATGAGTRTVEIEVETDPAENAASVGVKDEGTTVVAAVANVNFVGAGVTASDGGGGTATVTIPGVPSNSGYFYATSYGVVADGKSLADGAMTNGSAVLTSATAGFTLADVGKLVVVCNAKGAAHLYGTIAGFTNSTTVTLSTTATATVSAADFSYGTDDTANWLSCVAAAKAAKGTAILPPAMVCVTASTVIDSSFGITGPGCLASDAHMAPVAGAWNATNGSIAACNIPTKAPYLAGSQLLVMAANVDGIQITCPNGSLTVPLSGFGIRFAGMFTATGHGIVQTAAALAAGTPTQTGFDQGLMHTLWSDLKVFGHSGSKFAYKILNPLLNTFIQCHAFGGGGWQIEAYSSIVNQGNCVWIHPYICTVAGGIGYDLKLTGGSLNLLSFIRPQAINGTANLGSVWSGFSGIAAMTYTWQDNGAGGVSLISPDFEGPSTHVTAPGGGDYFITADALIANGFYNDNGPNPAIAVDFKRTFLTDLSFRLSQAEASGSTMKQLDDRVSAVLWGITTDGTVQNLRPGTTRHTGSTPSVTSGVAVGSGAPPCVVAGADSAGRAIFGSGTSTAAGAIASFTFARVMHTGAVVKLQANNSATQALGLYISALSTTGFTVSCATAPTASQAVTTYDFSWVAEDSTAVPVAPVVYDNFNRADNASVVGSPQLGSAPTVLTGTWGISSNQLYCSAGGGHVMWDAGKADATWQFKWAASGVPSQEGITFRATDDSNFWLAAMDGTLYKRVAGSFTTVTTYTAPAAGDTISVVTLGSSIKVFKNGTQIASVTDAALSTGTHVGFRTNTASAFRADNLQVS